MYLTATFRQLGLMPPNTKDYPNFPLTCGAPAPPTEAIENFHLAVGQLRCFDGRLTDPEQRIKCDWYDRDKIFVRGTKKIPQYTDLFWVLFFLAMKHYSPLRNVVCKVCMFDVNIFMYMYIFECICVY